MCAPKEFEQPAMVSSSSSSSMLTMSPPQSPTTLKAKPSRKWSMQMKEILVAILTGFFLTLVFGVSWQNDPSSLHSSSSICSLNGDNNSDSCIPEIDSEATAVPSSHHRGKVIGSKFNAKDLEAVYQSIKEEYAALALHPTSDTDWQTISSHKDGSKVSLLEHPTDPSCPYVRMTSVMPGTVQQVWDFLDLKNWATNMPKMDPFYEGLTLLGSYKHKGIDMKLARKTVKRITIFGKRDFSFVSVSDHPRGDGAWVSGTVSVVTDQIPKEQGYVRAYQDSIAFYETMGKDESGKPQMKLTIVFRLDFNDSRDGGDGGFMPMWAYVKTAGTTGMASVQNMKHQLLLMREARENNNIVSCDNKWLARIRSGPKKCN